MAEFELPTDRLLLRSWQPADRAPFAAMNSDIAVMEYFPALLTVDESDALILRFQAEFAARGFCPWAIEERVTGTFIGFVGLRDVPDNLSFAPGVEVGWRLARPFWGRGYATEAASAALTFGFETVGLTEIVSYTSAINLRSRRVMERLGMSRNPADDFEHPNVATANLLRPHVLYRFRGAERRASS